MCLSALAEERGKPQMKCWLGNDNMTDVVILGPAPSRWADGPSENLILNKPDEALQSTDFGAQREDYCLRSGVSERSPASKDFA